MDEPTANSLIQAFYDVLLSWIETERSQRAVRLFETNIGALREHQFDKTETEENPWFGWAGHPGVYYFRQGVDFRYVGRALEGTPLGNRIGAHIFTPKHGWEDLVHADNAIVGIYKFARGADFVITAFEAFLINRLSPDLNKKRQ